MWSYLTVVILNETTFYVYFLYFLLPNMFYTIHNSVFFKSFEFEFLSNLYYYIFFYLQRLHIQETRVVVSAFYI